MSLFPDNSEAEIQDEELFETEQLITKTYRYNPETGEIRGMVDNEESLHQWIWKAIVTARYKHVIYSDDYGCELWNVIGISDVNDAFIQAEMKRTIKEALIYDVRIDDVYDIKIDHELDMVEISLTVVTPEGLYEFKEVIR